MLTADELVEIMPSFKDRSAEFVDPINDAMRECERLSGAPPQ